MVKIKKRFLAADTALIFSVTIEELSLFLLMCTSTVNILSGL